MKTRKCDLLGRVEQQVRKLTGQGVLYSQAVAERAGINNSDLKCLDLINLQGGASAGELADATGLSTGAITGVIDRLEKAGLARREPDPDDRRRVLVRCLPKCNRSVESCQERIRRDMRDVWSRYTTAELELIADFLERSHGVCVRATARLDKGD